MLSNVKLKNKFQKYFKDVVRKFPQSEITSDTSEVLSEEILKRE